MKRPAVIHRKAPAPLSRERGACRTVPSRTVPTCTVPACTVPGRLAASAAAGALAGHGTRPLGGRRPQGGAAPRAGVPQGCRRLAVQLAELVFAAVRPGFVAACMVDSGRSGGSWRHRTGQRCPPSRAVPRRGAAGWSASRRAVFCCRGAGRKPPAAVPVVPNRTKGTFSPGCSRRSRRCSVRSECHAAGTGRRPGPGIGYFR